MTNAIWGGSFLLLLVFGLALYVEVQAVRRKKGLRSLAADDSWLLEHRLISRGDSEVKLGRSRYAASSR